MHSLSEKSRKQHNHRSRIYHESTLQQDERRFFYVCLAYAQNMQNHELNLWHVHSQATTLHQIFLMCFLLHSCRSARDLHHHFFFLILSEPCFFLSVISFARFSALMLSSFIDVSLCSVDAAHMHRRCFDDQMWICLWSRLMLLAYASHRAKVFSNPPPTLECAKHMSKIKFNPTPRIFSNPGSTFPTPYQLHPGNATTYITSYRISLLAENPAAGRASPIGRKLPIKKNLLDLPLWRFYTPCRREVLITLYRSQLEANERDGAWKQLSKQMRDRVLLCRLSWRGWWWRLSRQDWRRTDW